MFVEKLPVPEISENDKLPFIKCVNEILETKNKNICSISLENTLNAMVYNLFQLSEEEIALIASEIFSIEP
jgi:hypothetical protein